MRAFRSDLMKDLMKRMTKEEHRDFSLALAKASGSLTPVEFKCDGHVYQVEIKNKDVK